MLVERLPRLAFRNERGDIVASSDCEELSLTRLAIPKVLK